MLPKGHFFPGQKRDEQIILFIRRHWLSFLSWIISVFVMVCLPIGVYYNWKEIIFENINNKDFAYFVVVVAAYYLIVLAIFLTAWIEFYLNVMIITPEHLVDIRQEGLFNRRISEQSLLRVQDVSAHMRGMLQTFFLYGTVLVETAGEAPNFMMPNIPFPNRVANTILKLHEELIKKSGFEEEDLASGVGLDFHLKKFDQREVGNKPANKVDQVEKIEEKIGISEYQELQAYEKNVKNSNINYNDSNIQDEKKTSHSSDGVIHQDKILPNNSKISKNDNIIDNIKEDKSMLSKDDKLINKPAESKAGNEQIASKEFSHEKSDLVKSPHDNNIIQTNNVFTGAVAIEESNQTKTDSEGELREGEMVSF